MTAVSIDSRLTKQVLVFDRKPSLPFPLPNSERADRMLKDARNPAVDWRARFAAASRYICMRLAEDYPPQPSIPMPAAVLWLQAQVLGMRVEGDVVAHRVDSRDPTAIRESGFVPNPEKPSCDLYQHIEQCGSDQLVSLTKAEDSIIPWGVARTKVFRNLTEDSVFGVFRKLSEQADLRFPQLLARKKVELKHWEPTLIYSHTENLLSKEISREIHAKFAVNSITTSARVYQYRCENVTGVAAPDNLADYLFAPLQEITVPAVAAEQISNYRQINVNIRIFGYKYRDPRGHLNFECEPGCWNKFG